MHKSPEAEPHKLGRYLSPLSAWALSFGCAVGWGVFVMPGTTFLPVAGPLGTLIGLGIGAAIMFLLGRNYHYLIQNFPEAGGAYGYVKRVCGGDHGFICGWFLILTYVAIAWENVIAFALIGRHLLGGLFSFGFHYHVAGYDVYAGEVLLSVVGILFIGGVFLFGKRLAARLQTLFALVLCAGIAVCVAVVFMKYNGGIAGFVGSTPAFANGNSSALQVFAIVVLAPWAFVGFESVSHSAEEFAFPKRRTVGIIVSSLVSIAVAYIALTFVAASTCPNGFANWRDYIAALDIFDGLESLPVFYAVKRSIGGAGLVILCVTALASIATGLIGNVVASSRVLYAMSRDGLLWEPFSRLDRDGSPRNAIVATIAVSCLIPLVGRTAVRWIVDITTVSACIAYGYVSYCTLMVAWKEGRRYVMASGLVGVIISTVFLIYFLFPNLWVVDALEPESYFILSAWSIVGIVVFRGVFGRDRHGRLGTSIMAWMVLLFFIFFSGHMWNRQKTRQLTDVVVSQISERYAPIDKDGSLSEEERATESFLKDQEDWVNAELTRYNLIQLALVFVALGLMYSIYSVLTRREKEASKAKSYFFSTISHDIRTPLNAIVGFSQMLKIGFKTKDESDEAVDSILTSSKSLLSFVNDILDLSRRESGKSELHLLPTDCSALLREVEEAFRVGAPKKGVEIRAAIGEMPTLFVDPLLLRHVVVNLVSNAVKFTDRGFVEVRGRFHPGADGDAGRLVVEIEDTGVGIGEEDKHKIDSPYMQTASKISRNGGTGLGLAVCRQFAEMMGGTMTFDSELGKGSTFRITLPKVKVVGSETAGTTETTETTVTNGTCDLTPVPPVPSVPSVPPTSHRLLLVDDQKMNLTVLRVLVKRLGGFETETAADGKEALARLKDPDAPRIDAVLTDMWMPELDGEGLAKAIRADPALAHVPVHVITADVELEETYAEKGFDSIILKPVTVGTLGPLLAGLAERNG